jgi:uncharacterized NAD(P)/FAD-binding protein YdhS
MTMTAEPDQPTALGATRRVAIVGGGASGTLTALNLLRLAGPGVSVTVYERTGRLGLGVAYATTDGRHLLNVRASNMSAFPDVPGDLVAWAEEEGIALAPTDFLPRRDYARYLQARLAEVTAAHGDRLAVVPEPVTDVERDGAGFRVTTPTMRHGYDVVVLAYGNAAPSVLAAGGVPLPSAPWHVADPWDLSWTDGLAEDAAVVIAGTGLTAIDTAITLLDGFRDRRVVMVSRHGLLPKPHIDEQSTAWVSPVPEGPLTADDLAAFVCNQFAAAARRGVDWHWVVDGLRAPTQGLWRRLTGPERQRFLATYAREWEIRRHRMAPEIAARVAGYQAQGRLRVLGGGLGSVQDGVRPVVTIGAEEIEADVVVNCTGPLADVTRTDNPLLAALLRRGLARPDELRLGLDSTPAGEVLDAAGAVVPGLITVGPPRKGVLYETTAIPEIRVQAAEVATLLATR